MADTIDSISIELTASTQSAESSIDKLIGKLNQLKSAVTGASNLNRVAQGIARIAAVASGIDGDAGRKLSHLAAGLTALSKVGDLSNLKDAGKNLSSVSKAVSGMGQAGGRNLSGLADGIRQTNNALGGISDSDVSKLGAIRDTLAGEVSGPLHTSSRVSESAALGGMGSPEPSFGNMAAYGAMTVFKYTADSIRDAMSAYREFHEALGAGMPPIFTGFSSDNSGFGDNMRLLTAGFGEQNGPWIADEIRDATDAASEFGRTIGGSGAAIESEFVNTNSEINRTFSLLKNLKIAALNVGIAGVYLGSSLGTAIGNIAKSVLKLGANIVRIAKYRLIRAMLKDMTQSFKDLYGWSQLYGTDFAKSMDTINTAFVYLRNSISAMVAPLINMLAPAIDYIIDKVVVLLNWFNQFFAAISGASTYTVAREVAQTWGETFESTSQSARSAANDIKRTILGFDEINKLTKESGGTGGGGGKSPYTTGYEYMFEERPLNGGFKGFGDAIESALQDTLSRITLIVGAAELAIGAILALSGANMPLGIALIASGAVTMGSAIFANWEGISDEIKRVVSIIEAALAGGLAVGAILAFSGGNIPLGIGLMIGALSAGFGAVTIAWNSIGDTLGEKIRGIAELIGGALAGIGLVLMFASPASLPLGLGMLIAGLTITAVSIDWGKLGGKVGEKINELKGWLVGAELALGLVFLFSGNVPLGLALLIAGGIGAGLELITNWGNISEWFKDRWKDFKKAAEDTWDALKEIGAGIWGKIKEGISDSIKGIGDWIREHIFKPFTDWWHRIFGGGQQENVGISINAVANDDDLSRTEAEELRALGRQMGDAIHDGISDRMKNAGHDAWDAVVSGWNGVTNKILKAAFGFVQTAKEVFDKFNDEWNALNASIPVLVSVSVQKANWDATAWTAATMTNYSATRTLSAAVKRGTWDATAWLAANMVAFTAIRTVIAKVIKGAWDATAWIAASMTASSFIRTITSIVKKGTWDATAWLALNMTTSAFTINITADVKKGAWDATAWLAACMTSAAFTRTISSVIKKGAWDATAWLAACMTSAAFNRTISGIVKKGTWDATAWLAANMTAHAATRTVNATVQKAQWNTDAWQAANMVNGSITRTVNIALDKSGWTTVSSYLDSSFGGAFGGGGQTSGGGAGRYYVSVGLKDPTTDDASTFWNRLGVAWNAAVVAVDKGLDVVVRPVAKKTGSALGGFFGRIGEWLFGSSDTPETTTKVNATVGKGFSGITGAGKFNLTGITDANVTVNLKRANSWKDGLLSWIGPNEKTVSIKLNKYDWTWANKGFSSWIGENEKSVYIKLIKYDWTWANYGFLSWIGPDSKSVRIDLYRGNWYWGLSDWIGDSVNVRVNLVAGGGVFRDGYYVGFASGGIVTKNAWERLPKYASGTNRAHGTMFVAGEAGPEIVGHIGGRTEVLNRSQLAETMYAAVRSAMSGVQIAANVYDGASVDGDKSDYETMYRAMYDAFTDATAGSAERDREKVALMRQIAAKEFTSETTAAGVNRAQMRANRRAGVTLVPLGT